MASASPAQFSSAQEGRQPSATIAQLKEIFDGFAKSGDYDPALLTLNEMRGLPQSSENDDIIAESERRLAAIPRDLGEDPPMAKFPIPLPLRLVQDDTKVADPNAMPDSLDATLKNADPEKNPPLVPWNYWKNATWNSTFNLSQVAGAEAGKAKMQTALIDPYRAANYFPESLATRGLMLYGVAGTGKTTLATAAVNALSIGVDKTSGKAVVDPAGFRSEEEVAKLVANRKLPNWAARYWGAEPPAPKGQRKNKKAAASSAYVPRKDNGEDQLFKQATYQVPDPLEGEGKFVTMLPVPKVIFFNVTVADVKSVWVGESSRRLERWFELAQEVAPSIIFFDEAETYLDETDEHNADTITTFKQQFGGLMTKQNVTLIVATNYPMKIESAIRSRLAAGSVEIGLPDLEARKFMIGEYIDAAFRSSLLKPERYVEAREAVVNYIALRTRPPFSSGKPTDSKKVKGDIDQTNIVGEGEKRKRGAKADADVAKAVAEATAKPTSGLWSGRDLKALVTYGLSNARSKLLSQDAVVVPCIRGSNEKPCSDYQNPSATEAIYVPSSGSQRTSRSNTTSKVIQEKKGDRLQPGPASLEDFVEAFSSFSGSVDGLSVADQVQFNKERGYDTTPYGAAAQNWTNWYCLRATGSKEAGATYDPTKQYPSLGANTTVPRD